jgi:DNA-binding beta-propeller fold protein YncE
MSGRYIGFWLRFALVVLTVALACATGGAAVADASLGELSFLGCIGQVGISECAAVPLGFEGAVEEPKGLAVSPDGSNVYAADDDASAIDVFTRNTVTGTLTLTGCVGEHTGCVTTSPPKAVERPFAVAVSPDGKSVYAVSVGSNTVDEFARNSSNGELTYTGCIGQLSGCVPTTPAEAIDGPASIAISADGTSVYVASENAGGAVDEFQRDMSNGALKLEGCIGAGGCSPISGKPEAVRLADAVVISPDGKNVYVSGQGASISTFARNTSGGELTFEGCLGNDNECVQPSPLAINEPTSLAISPDGANVYAGNAANGVVDVLARDTTTGALTFAGCNGALSGVPGACTEMPSGNPAGPLTVAISPDGADLYVSGEQGVYEYQRGAAGALVFAGCTGNQSTVCTATVPTEALSFTVSLALSPNGANLYAGTQIAKDLDVFGRATLPQCSDITTATPYDTAIELALSCSDADGKAVSFAIAGAPSHGSLGAVSATGRVTYTPAAGFSGPDSFTFDAQNADGVAAQATATITVGSPAGTVTAKTPTTTGGGGPPSTKGIATTPKAVEEVLLACTKRPLVLNDVLIRGSRVLLEGSAAASLHGKKVKIIFDGRKLVATAIIGVNGEFSATAPLPPARLRDSNSARYMAEAGSQRSLDLKLTRRLVLEPPKFSAGAGTVTLVGQLLAPLTKPVASVSVQQQLECGATKTVGSFKASTNGRFRITFKVPAIAKAGLYRLASSVAEKPGAKHGFATYSLPLPVILG